METSGYSAEYGRMAGSILNMTLRSVTNDIHGNLSYFLRADVFDARGFFEPEDNDESSPESVFGDGHRSHQGEQDVFYVQLRAAALESGCLAIRQRSQGDLEKAGDFGKCFRRPN